MEILGLSGVQAAIFITVVGIALTNIVGYLKNANSFKWRNSLASGILALIVTLPTIAVTIGQLPNNLTELEQLAFIATYLGQVAGFDALGKGMIKAAKKTPKDGKIE